MNKNLYRILFIIILLFSTTRCFGVEKSIISYAQYTGTQSAEITKISPIQPKSQRTSISAGHIHLIYDDIIPDSMRISIKAAAEFWESKISNLVPIYIHILFDCLDNELSLICDVYYAEDHKNSNAIPCSLYAQKYGSPSSPDSPDAYITFNSNIDWNCSHSAVTGHKGMNTYTSMLRAVAICLGFGSSITQSGNKIVFQERFLKSPFDKLIFSSDNEWLKDFESGSSDLSRFVQPPVNSNKTLFITNNSPNYKLYAPSEYIMGKSLVYMDNVNSLMHYDLRQGEKNFNIDDITIEILNSIGWNLSVNKDPINIISNDLSETGTGSAYESHSFSINNQSNKQISNPKWTFNLFDKNQKTVEIKTLNSSKFTIPVVDNPNAYYITSNGDLKGEIIFSCYLDGSEYQAKPYRVSLELKPSIISISNIKTLYNNKGTRELTCDINYVGSDYLRISVEEDMSSVLKTSTIEEPFIAHAHVKNISLFYDAWVDIIVSNKYGHTTKTIELPANLRHNKFSSVKTPINTKKLFKVYDLDGQFIGLYESVDYIRQSHAKGIYIVESYLEGELIDIKKILI